MYDVILCTYENISHKPKSTIYSSMEYNRYTVIVWRAGVRVISAIRMRATCSTALFNILYDQNKVVEMTSKRWVTCSFTSFVAVYRGRVSRQTLSKRDIRKLATRNALLLLKLSALAFPVCILNFEMEVVRPSFLCNY